MKVGIVGCAGRMGQMLVREVLATSGCELCGGTESPGHLALGQDIAAHIGLSPRGLDIQDDTPSLFQISDVVIDFTLAAITETHTALAVQHGTKLILGTTGHDEQQISSITAAANRTTIVKAMNFSVGINILLKLTNDIARTVDEEFDIELHEALMAKPGEEDNLIVEEFEKGYQYKDKIIRHSKVVVTSKS